MTAILVLGAPVTAALQGLQSGNVPAVPVLAGQSLVLLAGAILVLSGLRRWQVAPVPASAAA